MADFKTHLTVASTLSGVVAIGCLQAGIAEPREVLVYFAAGAIGGMLPDIDADHSIPLQAMFRFFAVLLAFFTVFSQAGAYSLAELTIIWLGVYLLIRRGVGKLFARFTVHRGIFHSLLAAVFFWLLATAVSYHLFAMGPLHAWFTGCFVSVGYVVHLALDELYSVDLMGANLKPSFGTALKIASLRDVKATVILALVTLLLFAFATPRPDAFVQTLGNRRLYTTLHHKLLPTHGWFRVPR